MHLLTSLVALAAGLRHASSSTRKCTHFYWYRVHHKSILLLLPNLVLTIQAQQARIEQLESQQAMGGPVAPASTHVHSQQQSHAYTSSFNCHCSSEEVHISKKGKKKKKK